MKSLMYNVNTVGQIISLELKGSTCILSSFQIYSDMRYGEHVSFIHQFSLWAILSLTAQGLIEVWCSITSSPISSPLCASGHQPPDRWKCTSNTWAVNICILHGCVSSFILMTEALNSLLSRSWHCRWSMMNTTYCIAFWFASGPSWTKQCWNRPWGLLRDRLVSPDPPPGWGRTQAEKNHFR